MERITINAEFLFELKSKQEWVNRVPRILPGKTRSGEQLIWIDAVGNVFECGRDFEAAERLSTYPCRVYRPYHVDSGFVPSTPHPNKESVLKSASEDKLI